ncbi:hypothetical protein A6E05_05600 [Aliivibrio sp. 1S165]|uniref:KAP family P-loop NTPase fold protein n=1 Tax=unclassified Aliivibrio TaxID=2645654 RepID=UPI00080DF429|nr:MULTISPECIES: P-loop NTPase fold protein [unclassified Aliivibrio]OCH13781.1 hypothetical protein A6E05_05600 [Aliivibrio sp. 1S165]OCH31577.1 hypothetical protein A6E06_02835 [Aliivibrio sp. 1S175]
MTRIIPEEEVFSKYTVIDNEPFADHLINFLNTKSDDGYVLNLNAEWGAGKTTFLSCLYNKLEEKHPVVYFDAWKSDFSKDAMLALVDCFHAQLASSMSENKDLVKSLFNKSSHFIRKALPTMVVGYAKHKTGMPEDESLIKDITTSFGIDISEDGCGEALKEVLKDILEQRQKVDGIEEFKNTLVSLAKAVIESTEKTNNPKQYPIYILIDELDRCRPNYAIEVIESIKHFFDTKNFVFVIATDTEQLQHSVKAIYGHDFNAHAYLSRFFHKTVTLPAPSLIDYLLIHLEPIIGTDFSVDELFFKEILESIFKWHNMTSLREISKVINDIEMAKVSGKQFKLFPLIILSILKRLHPEKYVSYTDSNELPYTHSNNPQGTAHLPRNLTIKPIKFNNSTNMIIEDSLYYLLNSLSSESSHINWESIKIKEQRDRHQSHTINSLIVSISFHYLLNPQSKNTDKSTHVELLELAGHFK